MLSDIKNRAGEINERLKKEYPEARCALNYGNAFELLVATILSAQCTDERVNIVTATLFGKYRKPQDYLNVEQTELERDIRSAGFYRNKARSIQGASEKIIENFGGEIPQTMEQMLTLNGVARKTANVVLGNAFGIASGVVVDTHVSRLSQRLGLTENVTPEKIEKDLSGIVEQKDWIMFPHRLIFHGRKICQARKPKCEVCVLSDICPKIGLPEYLPKINRNAFAFNRLIVENFFPVLRRYENRICERLDCPNRFNAVRYEQLSFFKQILNILTR